MTTVFLTGSTGMIGSNIARMLRERGDDVRALVRPGSETGPLEELGVEIVRGDVTAAEDVLRGVEGSEYAIHSAALLGGPTQSMDEFMATNAAGASNVYDAAAKVGCTRVVALSTTTFFDQTKPLTEHSELDPSPPGDPYTQTKLRAYLDAMARVDDGQDICIVISGGAYGMSPLPERSMVAPSFNARAVYAIQGELEEYVEIPVPWVYADDIAAGSITALDKGVAGERYLGFGRPEDVCSMVAFCNTACEIAGSPHRVRPVSREQLDDPEMQKRFGPSLVALAKRDYPDPWFRNEQTVERLDYHPISLAEGLGRTIPWLRETGLLSA
jgi:nucleoside-diphosphate-sugar epimerase